MSKSKEQKADEKAQLAAQQQQLKSNEFFMEMAKMMKGWSERDKAKQDSYYESNIDPALKGYAKSGFAPGERDRLRSQVSEDVGRAHTNAERTALDSSSSSRDAPSGINPYIQLQMARSRGEAQSTGMRNIENVGSQRRYETLGPMMARADRFDPLGSSSQSFQGRAGNVQDARIEKGFWQELGSATASGIGQAIGGLGTGFMTGGLNSLANIPTKTTPQAPKSYSPISSSPVSGSGDWT